MAHFGSDLLLLCSFYSCLFRYLRQNILPDDGCYESSATIMVDWGSNILLTPLTSQAFIALHEKPTSPIEAEEYPLCLYTVWLKTPEDMAFSFLSAKHSALFSSQISGPAFLFPFVCRSFQTLRRRHIE